MGQLPFRWGRLAATLGAVAIVAAAAALIASASGAASVSTRPTVQARLLADARHGGRLRELLSSKR